MDARDERLILGEAERRELPGRVGSLAEAKDIAPAAPDDWMSSALLSPRTTFEPSRIVTRNGR
jgi:hypothetical protein